MQIAMTDILSAQKRLAGRVLRTPLVASIPLSERLGANVWLKPEHWQLTGSFKVRGAFNKMLQLTEEEKQHGVITASAGNHGQAVALVAQLLGVSALVVVPKTTPQAKLDGIAQYRAETCQYGDNYDDAEIYAMQLARDSERVFIHAFEDTATVAGQGTVGLEMLQDAPDIDTILVPAGGGGLMVGIGIAAKTLNPAINIIGVQSEASPVWYASWKAGHVVDVEYQETWAEGLLGEIGMENFRISQSLIKEIGLVSEEQIREAMRYALKHHRFVLEGSGAAALAYALFGDRAPLAGRNVAIVLTGGNLDYSRLKELVEFS